VYQSAVAVGIRTLSQGSDDQALYDIAPALTEWWQLAIILGGYDTTPLHWYPDGLDPDQYRYGAHFFGRLEAGDDSWRLLWYRDIGDDDTLYPAFSNYDSAGLMDWMRIPCDSSEAGDVWTAEWPTCLTPIAWDEFTDANGTTLPNHTITYSLITGLVWVNAVGVWQITGNEADPDGNASAHAYIASTSPDVWVEVYVSTFNEPTAFAMLWVRKSVDTSGGGNYWRLQLATNRAAVDTWILEDNDGSNTIRSSADIDWNSDPRHLRGRADDQELTFYIDYVERLHYASAWFNRHATWHGIGAGLSTDNRYDNFLLKPRGTGLTRICYDSFTDPDGTSLDVHVMDEGGLTWVEDVGNWQIIGNEADPDNTANAIAYIESGVSDCWICDRSLNSIFSNGLVFRKSADTGGGVNHWIYWIRQNAGVDSVLQEFDDGVQTNRFLGDTDAFVAGTRYYIEMEALGQSLIAYVDGTQRANFALASFNETATWHGLFLPGSTDHRADQFRVTEIATPEYDAAIDIF
jgi:hypothetical protein